MSDSRPRKTKDLPRCEPTLQGHARHITCTATADGNATVAWRIEERELEAGGLHHS
jgi:hypothetical protein